MAFTSANLTLLADGNGFKTFRYDSTDAVAAIDGTGYINNADDGQNLAVGDLVWVVQWNTAVRTGTIADVSLHVAMAVTANAVDLSDDLLGATVANTD